MDEADDQTQGSLVFLDLESTGLLTPNQATCGRITEIALMGVLRSEMQSCLREKKVPRSRWNLCIPVHPGNEAQWSQVHRIPLIGGALIPHIIGAFLGVSSFPYIGR